MTKICNLVGDQTVRRLFVFVILLFNCKIAFGQVLIGSAGNNGNVVSISVGEAFIGGGVNGNSQLTQGFQQPNLWGIKIQEQDTFELIAYPNPVKDYLILESKVAFNTPPLILLYTSDGKLLLEAKMPGLTQTLDFAPYAAGSYTLIIVESGDQLASFRIVKSK